jgi:hypothetical protein
MAKKTKKLGTIGVDAGMCWIGDPCYVLPDDARDNPGKDWGDFCEQMLHTNAKEFASGVCVTTGYGDGEYPVHAKVTEDGCIASITVTFIT